MRKPLLILGCFLLLSAAVSHAHFVEWRSDLFIFTPPPETAVSSELYIGSQTVGGPQIFSLLEEEFDCAKLGCPKGDTGLMPLTFTRLGIYARESTVLPWTTDFEEIKRRGQLYGLALPVVLIFAAVFAFSFLSWRRL